MWTPDAYQGAPTPVTAFMAAGVKAAGFAAIVRFVMIGLAPASGAWEGVVWWLAVLTMIVPNLIALAQDDVKRLLAYSSIAHAGYLLVGVASANEMGRSATVLYLAVYGLMTLGSFAVVYAVAGRGDAHTRLSDYRGLGWRRPVLGAAMVIFLLSLAGFPPTGGFIGKLYLLLAAVEAGQVTLAIVLVMTSLVSYYYYLRVIWKMYFEQAPEEAPAPSPTGGAFRLAAVMAAAGILLIGIFPGPALRTAGRAGADLVSRAPAPSTASPVSDREQESAGQAR
jgi:NADH-quinone oxidoreductase subunit N